MADLRQEVTDIIHRSMDAHVRIAVTGLSRAGKTAFIASMVNQLLNVSTHDNLPFLSAARNKRIIGAKRVAQSNMLVPSFAYDAAMAQLNQALPAWPHPTRDVSEIRLAIKYRPEKKLKRLLGHSSTLYVDIIDYPGEWLLDLPLLDMSYEKWSEQQLNALHGTRGKLASAWLDSLEGVDLTTAADDKKLADISHYYTDYLHRCKEQGLHWVQPGRFILPGELEGAPVLQFFPCRLTDEQRQHLGKESAYTRLERRFEEYKQRVVKAFYRNHFATFDRQIVLVDTLTPLNEGYDAFMDMRSALEQLLKSFEYGRSNLLSRLFAPKIDKVLFAATKVDHVTPDQHANVVSLLSQMIHPAWQHASYEGIAMRCISLASIRATEAGTIQNGGQQYSAIQGRIASGDNVTLYPGEVPKKLPSSQFWQEHQFDFSSFLPLSNQLDDPLKHIRMDTALEYLLGDKMQ
jgi:predicted YcjX-like family ATPase